MSSFSQCKRIPRAPRVSDLAGDHLDQMIAACATWVGTLKRVERITEGCVSHVFRVRGSKTNVIIKIRGTRLARIPELKTDPTLLGDEVHALKTLGSILPGYFPEVLDYFPEAHAAILTDIFPSGRSWQQELAIRSATDDEIMLLGKAIGEIHAAWSTVITPIRSQGDDWFREHTFDFMLRSCGHPTVLEACEVLSSLPNPQFVIGDASPKNICLAGGRPAFVDLDNVHRNSPIFDLAYVLAHLLLHHIRWPSVAPALAQEFLAAYSRVFPATLGTDLAERLVSVVASGILLYRLEARITPYRHTASRAELSRYRARVYELLDSDSVVIPKLIGLGGARL